MLESCNTQENVCTDSTMNKNPELILLFSGKRKSGKDFITDLLLEKFDKELAVIVKISGPIKSYWAQTNNVALDELLSSGETKEQYRKDMIIWSEQLRNQDPGVFCRQAIEMYRGAVKLLYHYFNNCSMASMDCE